ncbi:MAG: hypothetical protein CTR54_13745 [Rhizobium sp.]|nr:MAG: hypothetical protein CTR54_13745 [Rhizobium sp.]
MRILWAGSALLELIALRAYIAQYHPQAAARIAAEIVATAELLVLNPALGTALPKPGYRRLVIGGTVYVLIYRLRDEDLEIVEVFDARRRCPRTKF